MVATRKGSRRKEGKMTPIAYLCTCQALVCLIIIDELFRPSTSDSSSTEWRESAVMEAKFPSAGVAPLWLFVDTMVLIVDEPTPASAVREGCFLSPKCEEKEEAPARLSRPGLEEEPKP